MSETTTAHNIITEKQVIDGVPVINIEPAGGRHLSTVFYLHGFGGSKEDGRALGMLLAQSGLRAVCVDLYMHGDHRDPVPFPGMFPIVQHTADDLRRLMHRFHDDARGQIGVVGVSMGALVVFHLAATEPMVQAAVAMVGNPDFEASFLRLTEIDKDVKWLSINKRPLWEAMLSMGQAMNPKDRLSTFYPKPLLMLNGRHDPFVDLKHASELYEQLQTVYHDQLNRLELHVHEGGHEVTPAMEQAAATWFSQYLLNN